MYNEEYEKKGFPILSTILKVLIIGIIILLLILFIPKLFTNKTTTSKDNKQNDNCSDKYEKSLNALTSQIFSNNLDKMKDAAIKYYTTERLPQEISESDKMTLSDMIGKKLVVALIDKNNKAVDVEKSYVKITKTEDEYILKVNIKDSEKEDYILVHLGCYSYCKNDICEKETNKNTNVPTKGSKPTSVVVIKKNNTIINNNNNNNNNNSEENNEYICEYKNGKYYDNNGNRVSELTYIKICEAPVCKKVNGYYFDSRGNNTTKYKYEKDCTSKPTPTKYKCEYRNGKYYNEDGKVVSKLNYLISCEKPVCKKIDEYYFGKYGKSVSKSTYEKQCTSKPTPTKYKCEYRNGKYYNEDGKVVSKLNYLISCEKPVCKKIDEYYFGKYGKSVSKSTYEKQCTSKPTPTSYKCEYRNGKYYNANGKVVSKLDYLISCEKPKCKIIDEYYFGKYGKSVSKSTYEKQCNPKEYIYEYSKTTNTKLSEWSNWSNWEKTDCNTSEVNCNDNDITCLNKLQLLKKKEQIGTYQKTYATTRNILKQTGSYIEKSCSKYNYIEINKTIYATTTTTHYTTINTISSSTQGNYGSWTYNGRASYSNPPRDTNGTHYKFVGADYSYCSDTCTSLPNYYYDSYTYTGGLTKVSSTTIPGNITSSTTATTSKEYKASCGEYTYKTIPIYGTITVTEKAKRDEPLYGTICYQSTKTRKVTEKGKTTTKWSNYNDKNLLDNGWEYTGRKKVK